MRFHVTRAYLDMARAVVDTPVSGDPDAEDSEDVLLALASCTCLYGPMAPTSFSPKALPEIWREPGSPLRARAPRHDTFEAFMRYEPSELKKALPMLAELKDLKPLHKALPRGSWTPTRLPRSSG